MELAGIVNGSKTKLRSSIAKASGAIKKIRARLYHREYEGNTVSAGIIFAAR